MMKKSKTKRIATLVVTVVIVLSLAATAAAVALKDSLFTFNTPTYITPNSSVEGVIESKTDYEAYMFDVTANGALTVRLNHDNMADALKSGWKVTLYLVTDGETHEYKQITFFNSLWSDVTSSWGETGVAPGTYCVVVTAGDYFIKGDFELITTFTPTENYEKEFNDTKATATPLSVNKAIYASSSQRESGNDSDWFKLTLKDGDYLNINFVHTDASLPQVGWKISLLTANEDCICEFTSKLSEPNLSSGNIGLNAGTYYVLVDSQVPYGLTYQLLVTSGKDANIETELNDTPETADILNVSETVNGSLSSRIMGLDKDYYKITVPSNGYINIEFSHANLAQNKNGWNVRLYKKEEDGSYYQIVRKISKWNAAELSIKKIGLEAGDYYICVDADSMAFTSEKYSLYWQFSKNAYFEKEPNDNLSRANPINVGTEYHGTLLTSDVKFDTDYYKFELTETTNICLMFYHDVVGTTGTAWEASIVDKGNNVVDHIVVDSPMSAVSSSSGVKTLPAGTYFVKVQTGLYESESEYSFRIAV